ncbi:MAG: cation-translocating P-type ATPase [Thermodesulfobacteriota bacterium]
MIGRFTKPGVYRELLRRRDFYVSALAGGLALAGFGVDYGGPESGWGIGLALAAVVLNGLPIIWGAVKGLWARKVNVDELVSLAIIASLIQGEYLTAAVVSLVMTFGALIEQVTGESARKAIQSLANISPRTATIIVDGETRSIPVEQVRPGDRILIKPGDRLPVDAIVLDGISAVDESSLTGEPIPREKRPGDQVLAGTLNHNGVLEAQVEKIGPDTTLGRLIRLIEEAEGHRPEVIRLVDRWARWFTPTILACAGLAWLITGDVQRAVAVLIVGCPCALILAAPTATVAALGRAARMGLLVKGGHVLEKAAATDAVFFDKTGTLTLGRPRVEEIACAAGRDKNEILSCAASAEQYCNHPLGRAVLKAAHYSRVALHKAEAVISEIGLGVRASVAGSLVEVGSVSFGGGIMALPLDLRITTEKMLEQGQTPLVIYRDHQPVGVLGVSDQVRPAARTLVQELKSLHIENVAILSGDQPNAVRRLAGQTGVVQYYSEQKPQDKLAVIRKYQEQGRRVMYVGDGLNDGPALAASDVGVAMGAAGVDVALETAGIALIHDDIAKLPFLIRLGRRMLGVIKLNLVFGLVFNAVAVIAGGWGWLSPIMAALVHNIGSVLVVMTSASLVFFQDKQTKVTR